MTTKPFYGTPNSAIKILLIAGIHGDELTPVNLLMKFCEKYSRSSLPFPCYKVTVINMANIEALRNNNRLTGSKPIGDLNREFGAKDNYASIIKTLDDTIKEHDIVIDIHSSPNVSKEFFLINGNQTYSSTSHRIHCTGQFYIDAMNDFNLGWMMRYSCANTIKQYALSLNKLAFTLELNGMGKVDKQSSNNGLLMIESILANCVSLIKRHENFIHRELAYKELAEVNSKFEGVFYRNKPKDSYTIGEVVGTVLDGNANYVGSVIMPETGTIYQIADGYYVKPGDSIITYQSTSKLLF